jgi:hypothetical protein
LENIMAQIALKIGYDRFLLLQPGMLDKLATCKALGSVGYGDNQQFYEVPSSKLIEVVFLDVENITIHPTREAAGGEEAE